MKIKDMADYYDVFFAVENTTFLYWSSHPDMNDRDVIDAFNSLIRDFNNQKEGSLASEISKGVKAILILRKRNKNRDYTFGEIISCILLLIKLANEHESSDGMGYLKWIKAFFEGRMPKTEEEIMEYILQNET
ncbi:MAG: hypothetical protein QMC77_01110 [Methanocellales archaeon]|nr:hypothetical protein [Methanocellales archaeon]